jgi:hypothetical protein
MSVLETPRVYFKGEITWDPITTNNYSTNYDENSGDPIYPSVMDQVQAFRKQAISQVSTAGNWNPHGTHRAKFYATTVNGYDLGNGFDTHDPLVSVPVNFTGMLVDLEPFGAYTSQLFFDSMQFGIDGGYRISAPRTSRITARYINFARNRVNKMIAGVASAVWQTSFAKTDGLVVDAFDSTTLQKLAKKLEDDDVFGLTVRFNTYRTIYYDNPGLTNGSPKTKAEAQALLAKLNDGGFQPNPARSLLVGVVGLWRRFEPPHEPGERALIQAPNSPLGSAYVRQDGSKLILDLSNSVPEVDEDLKKAPLGTLSVVAVNPADQSATELGTIAYAQYDRAAYESSAGIVIVQSSPQTAQLLSQQNLQVRQADKTVLLSESPLRAIPIMPNLYLDEGQQGTASFQLYKSGQPLASKVPVTLYQLDPNGNVLSTFTLQSDANGVISLPLEATTGQIVAFVPSLSADDQPGQGINPQVNTYMYFRVRPSDSETATLPPTWSNTYTKVLANWNAMAPCMDNWLRLDDPAQVKAYGRILKRLTDPEAFESFRFMPATRDMSVGQRTLLYNFLDAPAEETAEFTGKEQGVRRSFAELSRAMRRG